MSSRIKNSTPIFNPQALKRKMVLTEDELERSETKGTAVTADLNEASERDQVRNSAGHESKGLKIKLIEFKNNFLIGLLQRINKAIKTLEHKNMIDEERIDLMENQVKEAKQMVEESDIKYDEVARKLAMVEGDLERAEERANAGENKASNFPT